MDAATYWKDYHHFCLILDNYRQVIPYFKSLESLMNEDILNLGSWYKTGS